MPTDDTHEHDWLRALRGSVDSIGRFVKDPTGPVVLVEDAEAMFRYGEALGRGLSDAEAREEGWPE